MTYKYVLKWRTGENAKVSVEAWPSSTRLALPHERKKPSFVIGSAKGRRTALLLSMIQDMKIKYTVKEKNGLHRIDFPFDDISAIADVYRIGLAAEIISRAQDMDSADDSFQYVLRSTTEEIWFWASKLLGVIGSKMDSTKVLTALSVLSNSSLEQNNQSRIHPSPKIETPKYRLDPYM